MTKFSFYMSKCFARLKQLRCGESSCASVKVLRTVKEAALRLKLRCSGESSCAAVKVLRTVKAAALRNTIRLVTYLAQRPQRTRRFQCR